jgi:hypothetical protein
LEKLRFGLGESPSPVWFWEDVGLGISIKSIAWAERVRQSVNEVYGQESYLVNYVFESISSKSRDDSRELGIAV